VRHFWGINEHKLKHKNQRIEEWFNTAELINAHLLLCGMSGTGKSYQIQQLMNSAIEQRIEMDIFDPHNELDFPGTHPILYSATNRYGYNPLVLNTDPHSGGVDNAIDSFIALLNRTNWKLGPKQEAALRNLLKDVYARHRCDPLDPNSWHKQEITEAQRNFLRENNRAEELRDFYPTIEDLIHFTEWKLKAMYTGANTRAVVALEAVNKQAGILERQLKKVVQAESAGDRELAESAKNKLEEIKATSIDLYTDYINNITSGRELDDVTKFISREVLQTTLERLQLVNAKGILRSNPPPGAATALARDHQLKNLSDDEQKLLVYQRMGHIYQVNKDKGVTDDLRHIILLDEAEKFFTDDKENILNIIATQARKFGVGLWCASQSPTHFSENFLTSCGTTMLLGLHSTYWDMATRKLKLKPDALRLIKPREVAAIKMQRFGVADAPFQNVLVNAAA
jgi:hypothetical protein